MGIMFLSDSCDGIIFFRGRIVQIALHPLTAAYANHYPTIKMLRNYLPPGSEKKLKQ
jgi:hypothetical protein